MLVLMTQLYLDLELDLFMEAISFALLRRVDLLTVVSTVMSLPAPMQMMLESPATEIVCR